MDYPAQTDLERALRDLPRCHKLAFIASCAERVLPFYEAFARQDDIPGHDDLRRALDLVWSAAIGLDISQAQCAENRVRLLAASPNPELTYRSPFVPNASDAVDMIQTAYAILSEHHRDTALDVQGAIECGLLARNTIDLYLALATLPELVPMDITAYRELGQIDYTVMPMFRAEVKKQEDDLMLLQSVSIVNDEVVLLLRTRGFVGVQPVTRFGL